MSFRTTRARRASSFQFEALEDRSLLNAAIPASPSAEIHTLKKTVLPQIVQGTLAGTFTVKGLTVSLMGTGNLSSSYPGTVLGATTITGKFKLVVNSKTHVATVTLGTATLTSGAGKIKLSFTGSGKNTGGLLTFNINNKKGRIAPGSSGHFKAATGSFKASGTAQELAGTFQLNNFTATVKTLV
jgi:hypothetical protein